MEPLRIQVPKAVQAIAQAALELHRTHALPFEQEVSGVALAERLVTGEVSVEDVASIARFFRVNERHYAAKLQAALSSRVDGLARSWALRGGEHGKVWSERKHEDLVRQGVALADSYSELLGSSPDEIYSRFAVGAFRWEYGLDTPAKAARFYEDYHRATGKTLDLHAAFGPSGEAVANAIRRRVYGVNPFDAARRALQFEDAEYRLAAMVDLNDLRACGVLEENVKPFMLMTGENPTKATIGIVWPVFVAYMILAAEKPDLLGELHGSVKRPPTLSQEPLALIQYCDAVRIYVAFFHPKGAFFKDPAGTKFEDLPNQLEDLMVRAHFGKKIVPSLAQKALGAARRWMAENKIAGSLFHIYNADWRKGNWTNILDDLPLDCDVRGPFQKFIDAGALPAEGVKLQQTLSDKKQLKAIADFLNVDDPETLEQQKIQTTEFGAAAAKLGTPAGIYSVIRTGVLDRTLLGCFRRAKGWAFVLQRSTGELNVVDVNVAHAYLLDGTWKVTKAHKDMKLGYSAEQSGPKSAAMVNPKNFGGGEPPAIDTNASSDTSISKPIASPSFAPADVKSSQVGIKGPDDAKQPPGQSTPMSTVSPFGLHIDEVVQLSTGNYWIRGVTPKTYRVLPLAVSQAHHSIPVYMPRKVVEEGKVLGKFSVPESLTPFVTVYGGVLSGGNQTNTISQISQMGDLTPGASTTGGVIVAVFAADFGTVTYPVVVVFDGSNLMLKVVSAVIGGSTYAPTDPKPESAIASDPNALSGTSEAFSFIAAKSWTPVTAADGAGQLKLQLAGVYQYGTKNTRTILGYAKNEKEQLVYVIRTDKGTINWKTAIAGNFDYKPLLYVDDVVLADLLPPPGAQKSPALKLNYVLSAKAKAIVQSFKLKYVPAPADALFKVNIPLVFSNGVKTAILAWVNGPTGPEAVLDQGGATDYGIVSKAALANLSRWHAHGTEISAVGEAVFGKGKNHAPVTVVNGFDPNNVIVLPSAPPDGWDAPAPVTETTIAKPSPGKHVQSGILAVFPAGATLSSAGGVFVTDYASIVLVYPSDDSNSSKIAIPRGVVDKGESPMMSAVKSFFESTGMTAKPVAMLGDFRSESGVVRLYVGYVTGGNPHDKAKGKDVDAVTCKPLVDLSTNAFKQAKWWTDLLTSGGLAWQQDAVSALVSWLNENTIPQSYAPKQTPAVHSAVTHAGQGSKTAASVSTVPDGGVLVPADPDVDVWKLLLFKSPFPVTTAMVSVLQEQVSLGKAAMPTEFNTARTRSVGPSFGQLFETEAGTPYTAAGYVSWLGTDGKYHHYLLGLSGAGLAAALPATAAGAEGYHVFASDTESTNKDPWFSHPDPGVMARMKLIFDAGGDLKAGKIGMEVFKLKWLKEGEVPYYAVSTLNIVRELAGLFVPGALTEVQKNAVLAGLKARMAATQSGKKKAMAPSAPVATGSLVAPSAPVAVAPKKAPVVSDEPLVTASMLSVIANPTSVTLKAISATTLKKASKPVVIVQDPAGNKFFIKWRPGVAAQAETDKIAAVLAARVKSNVVPVGVLDYEGQRASIQPFFDAAEAVPNNPNDLSDANKAELLSQHAFDMFVGDYDGHAGNWIQTGAKIVPIDKSQSFKFLLMGRDTSIDPREVEWEKSIYARLLLLAWMEKKAEIPSSAFAAMRATIESIQSNLTTDKIRSVFAELFALRKMSDADVEKFLNAVEARRAGYFDAWTKVLRSLRSGFKWPGASGGLKVDPKEPVLKSKPSELGFGVEQEETLKQAVEAGWRGKSLRIDGPWIENQEVMCRAVFWDAGKGNKTPATLLHFRLTKQAGQKAASTLLASGVVEVTDGAGGPQRLLADKSDLIYEKLFAAIKTINYHLNGVNADGKPNAQKVAAALAMKPVLQVLLENTKTKGTFGPTGEPNEVVNAMADQYLGYISTIDYWNANAASLTGQHSPMFTEFVYEPPPAVQAAKPKKAFKAHLKNQGASYPNVSADSSGITVTGLHKPVVNSSLVSQFVVEDPATGGKLFFNPTVQSGDVKAGVQGVKGLCWGVIPGEPSAPVVARLLKLFGEATGISMSAATEDDQRVLYLAKQASALQGGGQFTPTSDGTALVDPELASAMSVYEAGDRSTAVQKLRSRVAALAGMSVKDVDAALEKDFRGAHDAFDAGFYRHSRIGWDRSRLLKVLGDKTYVAHALLGHGTTIQFFKDVATNGALLANEVKPFYGVVKEGASPSSDFQQGGSQGVFCCLRKGSFQPKHLYFDLSLALRLDVYMVGKTDSYGNVTATRYTMPDKWIVGEGSIGASSGGQIVVRHDIDLQTYLVAAKCSSKSEADDCIALVKKLGWKFRFGTPEKIFVW